MKKYLCYYVTISKLNMAAIIRPSIIPFLLWILALTEAACRQKDQSENDSVDGGDTDCIDEGNLTSRDFSPQPMGQPMAPGQYFQPPGGYQPQENQFRPFPARPQQNQFNNPNPNYAPAPYSQMNQYDNVPNDQYNPNGPMQNDPSYQGGPQVGQHDKDCPTGFDNSQSDNNNVNYPNWGQLTSTTVKSESISNRAGWDNSGYFGGNTGMAGQDNIGVASTGSNDEEAYVQGNSQTFGQNGAGINNNPSNNNPSSQYQANSGQTSYSSGKTFSGGSANNKGSSSLKNTRYFTGNGGMSSNDQDNINQGVLSSGSSDYDGSGNYQTNLKQTSGANNKGPPSLKNSGYSTGNGGMTSNGQDNINQQFSSGSSDYDGSGNYQTNAKQNSGANKKGPYSFKNPNSGMYNTNQQFSSTGSFSDYYGSGNNYQTKFNPKQTSNGNSYQVVPSTINNGVVVVFPPPVICPTSGTNSNTQSVYGGANKNSNVPSSINSDSAMGQSNNGFSSGAQQNNNQYPNSQYNTGYTSQNFGTAQNSMGQNSGNSNTAAVGSSMTQQNSMPTFQNSMSQTAMQNNGQPTGGRLLTRLQNYAKNVLFSKTMNNGGSSSNPFSSNQQASSPYGQSQSSSTFQHASPVNYQSTFNAGSGGTGTNGRLDSRVRAQLETFFKQSSKIDNRLGGEEDYPGTM